MASHKSNWPLAYLTDRSQSPLRFHMATLLRQHTDKHITTQKQALTSPESSSNTQEGMLPCQEIEMPFCIGLCHTDNFWSAHCWFITPCLCISGYMTLGCIWYPQTILWNCRSSLFQCTPSITSTLTCAWHCHGGPRECRQISINPPQLQGIPRAHSPPSGL